MIYSIVAYAVVLVALGLYAFFSLRRDGWRKWASAFGYPIMCALTFLGFMQCLGSPIPRWALLQKNEMDVIAIYFDEPKAIYVWGYMEGKIDPIVVQLPFSIETAEKMYETQEEAVEQGAGLAYEFDIPIGDGEGGSEDGLKIVPLIVPEKDAPNGI